MHAGQKRPAGQFAASGRNPVDLVHLSTQTMGDTALEAEILALFLSQLDIYVNAWMNAGGQQARKLAAHSLKGAARAIGAFDLADLAQSAELPGFARFADLEAETGRVGDYIRFLLGRNRSA